MIINIINNQLGNLCPNLLNIADFYEKSPSLNLNPTPNNLMLSSSSDWSNVVYRIPVESGKTYYFKGSFTSAVRNQVFLSMSYNVDNLVNTRFWNYEPYSDILGPQVGSWSTSFVSDRTGYVYLGIWVTKGDTNGNNASYFEMMFDTKNDSFCAFGSYSSKLDDTNSKLDDINNTLNNDNVDSGVGSGFFNDFSDNDPGGISGIVTSPLLIINSLLEENGKCNSLPLPSFMGVSNAVFPSGCIFWNKVSSDLPIGITLWNIFVCGVGSYLIIIDLFKLINNLKTPTHNKVEVLDL